MRTVALVMDMDELKMVCGENGVKLERCLKTLKENGLTGVALSEMNLEKLENTGDVQVTPAEGGVRILVANAVFEKTIVSHLRIKWEGEITKQKNRYFLYANRAHLRALGLGFSPEEEQLTASAGLEVFKRPQNFMTLTHQKLTRALPDADGTIFIFSGTDVYGYPKMLRAVGRRLRKTNTLYGTVEFGKQKGDQTLGLFSYPNVVRVHSINSEEMKKISVPDAVERFVRAVRERNIRVCYLRPFSGWAGVDDVKLNAIYVKKLAKTLQRFGFTPGNPPAFAPSMPKIFKIMRFFLFSGVMAAGVFLLMQFFTVPSHKQLWLIFIPSLGGWLLSQFSENIFLELFALGAAVVFPSLSMVLIYKQIQLATHNPFASRPFGVPLAFIAVSSVSLFGGILIAALLSTGPYMLSLQQFAGVKIAHLLPFAFLSFAIIQSAGSIKKFFNQPIVTWHVFAFFMFLAAVGVLLVRTGNEPPMAVSGVEMKFRSLLEQMLWVRPRTKEFLLGHPALVVSLFLFHNGAKGAGSLFFLAGMVGQVSMVNTFCHIHTPLLVSVVRTIHGLWMGYVIGQIAIWIVSRYAGTEALRH